MATTIITKYGSGAPTASDVVRGELAVDTENGRLYTENIAGSVVELGTNPTTLAVDTDTLVVDATNNRVGIGLTSPDTKLHLSDGGTPELRLESTDTSVVSGQSLGDITWESNDVSGGGQGVRAKIHAEAENAGTIYGLAFSTGTGAAPTEKVRITNTGNVGIGTDSPNALTHIYGGASGRTWTPDSADKLALEHSSSVVFDIRTPASEQGLILFSDADARARGILGYAHSSDFMYFNTAGAEAMRIDSSGNVGIGTDLPGRNLEIAGTGTDVGLNITKNTVGTVRFAYDSTGPYILDEDSNPFRIYTGGSERMRIDSSGNVGIGVVPESGWASNQTALQVGDLGADWQWGTGAGASRHITRNMYHDGTNFKYLVSTEEAEMYTQAAGNHHWYSNPNGTADATFTPSEKMRLDASGNLLVGKTANDNTTNGFVLDGNGTLNIVRSSEYLMRLNRTSTAGEIARFQKDGTTVGSIGTTSSTMWIAGNSTEDTGIRFYTVGIAPCDSSGTYRDNSRDLGSSTVRWDDVYATNGTIQTSDRNEKQDIEELSDAEQRVAVAAKGLLRKFRWKSSVAENGDDARIHFGIIAQDLQAAFEAEGLDAGRYAMFINTTWTDEETGEERSRMGVRYSELLAFIIAAI